MEWVEKYVGIPYSPSCREISGCDCYGLVSIIYENEFNIQLPNYSGKYGKDKDAIEKIYEKEIENWDQVFIPEIGDIAYFMMMGYPIHVGIYIGNGMFIHNYSANGSSAIGNIHHGKWKKRLIGFWRYDKS